MLNKPPQSRQPLVSTDSTADPVYYTWFSNVEKEVNGDKILTAPNGTRYKLVVSNAGVLSTVPA